MNVEGWNLIRIYSPLPSYALMRRRLTTSLWEVHGHGHTDTETAISYRRRKAEAEGKRQKICGGDDDRGDAQTTDDGRALLPVGGSVEWPPTATDPNLAYLSLKPSQTVKISRILSSPFVSSDVLIPPHVTNN